MDVQVLRVTFFFTVIYPETKVRTHGGKEVREEKRKKKERGEGKKRRKGGQGENKGKGIQEKGKTGTGVGRGKEGGKKRGVMVESRIVLEVQVMSVTFFC